jgi:dihydroorotate dehydrogenase
MTFGLARSALFALDAEVSHRLTLSLFSRFPALATAPFECKVPNAPVELLGLRFRNRVGLAAGLDKDGEAIEAWDRLGFGFIELGTVTPRPQPGNPKPRLFRLVGAGALINRLGFNNHGVDALVERVRRARADAVIGINIGKNADTPMERAADDYEHCLRKVYGVAGYVTVNISSPNTKNLRDLQAPEAMGSLLQRVGWCRRDLEQKHGKRVPIVVKVAPDLSADALRKVAASVREQGMDGMIATNTTVQRPDLGHELHAHEQGGLSGAPLKPLALAALRQVRAAVGKDFPVIGVGGIMTGADAAERREAGADLVQVYTGFIYRGPDLIAECARAVAQGLPLR